MTDAGLRDLVERARRGDTEAFGDLVDLHRQAVYRAALAALRSPEEAEDVAQEAFVTAFEKLDGFRGEASFKTWLLTITWRKALDRRATLSRWIRTVVSRGTSRTEDSDLESVVERLPATNPSHEDQFLRSELAAETQRLIRTLPVRLRDALLLVGSGEHTYRDAAAILGIPVGTVKWRVSEARRQVRQKLALPASGTTQPRDVAAAVPETAALSTPARRGARSPAILAAGLLEYAERPPFIDPLPAPEPIAIAALETERVTPERVDIVPLRFDTVQIEPIQVQR